MKQFNLIVAGGREFNDATLMANELTMLRRNELADYEVNIVCGNARGADMMGAAYAGYHSLRVIEFPAQWDTFGKSAGYRRNVEMAENAQGLLAFWDGKSRGTKHMIDIATERGLSVRVIHY